jgi:hypothetical protein
MLGGYCQGSPKAPLNNQGETHLKPAKTQMQINLHT